MGGQGRNGIMENGKSGEVRTWKVWRVEDGKESLGQSAGFVSVVLESLKVIVKVIGSHSII